MYHFYNCKVVRWIAVQGRYKIKLNDRGKKLGVKADNLLPLFQAGTYNICTSHVCSVSRVRIPHHSYDISGATAFIQNLKTQQYNGLSCNSYQEIRSIEATVFDTTTS